MNAFRGMYIRNTAHIILNLEYIRNADINELDETVDYESYLKGEGYRDN
jgi:hypothetical protein